MGAAAIADDAIVAAAIADDAIVAAAIADDAVVAAAIADNAVDIARLNVSDGSSGQVLSTNGSGTLAFISSGTTNMSLNEYSGNGSTTAFTLSVEPGTKNNTQAFIDGVYQEKATYNTSGTTITFTTAPASGTSVEVMCFTATTTGAPSDGTVSTAKLADDAVTAAKIADDAIVAAAIADDAVVQAAIADEAIDEARMQISNAGTNGQYLQKQSGDTGGLTWADVSAGLTLDTTVKTAGFTAAAGNQYLCDTSGGAFAVQLPSGSVGDTIGIIDYDGTFDTNNLTLTQSGSEKIFRVDANGTIDTKNWSTSIKYIDATVGWLPAGD